MSVVGGGGGWISIIVVVRDLTCRVLGFLLRMVKNLEAGADLNCRLSIVIHSLVVGV